MNSKNLMTMGIILIESKRTFATVGDDSIIPESPYIQFVLCNIILRNRTVPYFQKIYALLTFWCTQKRWARVFPSPASLCKPWRVITPPKLFLRCFATGLRCKIEIKLNFLLHWISCFTDATPLFPMKLNAMLPVQAPTLFQCPIAVQHRNLIMIRL